MTNGSDERVPLRSPWRFLAATSLFLAVLVVTSFLIDVHGVLNAAIIVILAVSLGWMLVRILVLGGAVLVTEELRAHGLFRTRTLSRGSIVRISPEIVDNKGLSVWAPVVLLEDGRSVTLKWLAGYSTSDAIPNARVRRQVAAMEAWLAAEGVEGAKGLKLG